MARATTHLDEHGSLANRSQAASVEREIGLLNRLRWRAEIRGIRFIDVSHMTQDAYAEALHGDYTVFSAICFSAADEVTMRALNYTEINVFTTHVWRSP